MKSIQTGILVVLLSAVGALAQDPVRPRGSGALTPFEREKARWLLRERLPCRGCHEIDGAGGRIGPSLTNLGARRSVDYVYAMLRDPQGTVPGTVMPRVPMPPETRALLARYLVRARVDSPAGRQLPGAAPAPTPDDASALYERHCAACHGESGDGRGPNARFLPVAPTEHADSVYMSSRSDDMLFDAISAGGYFMDRSHLMPPFGSTLTREQIWSLVRHLRILCNCEGPAWSEDN